MVRREPEKAIGLSASAASPASVYPASLAAAAAGRQAQLAQQVLAVERAIVRCDWLSVSTPSPARTIHHRETLF